MTARLARRFAGCERGVAALEFALVAPFLILLLLGGFELSRFIFVEQKVEKLTFSLADITSQYDEDDQVDLDQVFAAIEHIMKPLSFSADGRVVLTSVTRSEDEEDATVVWQCSNGNLVEASRVGPVGQTATPPNNFVLHEKDSVVVAEVFYKFTPVFGTTISAPFVVYRTALFRPRLGALTNIEC